MTIWAEDVPLEGNVPSVVHDLLEKFKDVMPFELPKHLPPGRGINHKIELMVPNASYRVSITPQAIG